LDISGGRFSSLNDVRMEDSDKSSSEPQKDPNNAFSGGNSKPQTKETSPSMEETKKSYSEVTTSVPPSKICELDCMVIAFVTDILQKRDKPNSDASIPRVHSLARKILSKDSLLNFIGLLNKDESIYGWQMQVKKNASRSLDRFVHAARDIFEARLFSSDNYAIPVERPSCFKAFQAPKDKSLSHFFISPNFWRKGRNVAVGKVLPFFLQQYESDLRSLEWTAFSVNGTETNTVKVTFPAESDLNKLDGDVFFESFFFTVSRKLKHIPMGSSTVAIPVPFESWSKVLDSRKEVSDDLNQVQKDSVDQEPFSEQRPKEKQKPDSSEISSTPVSSVEIPPSSGSGTKPDTSPNPLPEKDEISKPPVSNVDTGSTPKHPSPTTQEVPQATSPPIENPPSPKPKEIPANIQSPRRSIRLARKKGQQGNQQKDQQKDEHLDASSEKSSFEAFKDSLASLSPSNDSNNSKRVRSAEGSPEDRIKKIALTSTDPIDGSQY
jgi:hypothetical protein